MSFDARVAYALYLRDLDAIKYFCLQTNVNYTRYLYGDSCNKNGIDTAMRLADTKGLVQVCRDFWRERKDQGEFNRSYSVKTNLKEAVSSNDTEGLKYIFNNTEAERLRNVLWSSNDLVEIAYFKQYLQVAELLRERGVSVDPKYLVHTNLIVTKNEYIEHARKIGAEHESLARLLFENSVPTIDSVAKYYLLLRNTYSFEQESIIQMYDSLFRDTESILPVYEVLKVASIMTLFRPIKIFFHNRETESASMYRLPLIDNGPFSNAVIYQSSRGKNREGIFIHELGHYVFDALFDNISNVYKKDDPLNQSEYFNKYYEAISQTCDRILQTINRPSKDNYSYENKILYIKDRSPLWLIRWYMHHSQSAFKKADNSEQKELTHDILQIYNYSSNLTNAEDQTTFMLNKWARINISQADQWILYRLHSFMRYDPSEFHYELLNRLPELLFTARSLEGLKNLRYYSRLWIFGLIMLLLE